MNPLQNIRLGSSIEDNLPLIRQIWNASPQSCELVSYLFLKYEMKDEFLLKFNLKTGKLAQISYLKNCRFEWASGIKVGDPISKVMQKHTLAYDDDENFFHDVHCEHVLAFAFESPYESAEENPNNKLEEITLSDRAQLHY
jgi:hypothetical protein